MLSKILIILTTILFVIIIILNPKKERISDNYKYVVKDQDFYILGYTNTNKLNKDRCIKTTKQIACGTFTIQLNKNYKEK